jgi:hypothetical protein
VHGALIRVIGNPVLAGHLTSRAGVVLLVAGVALVLVALGAETPLAVSIALLMLVAKVRQEVLLSVRADALGEVAGPGVAVARPLAAMTPAVVLAGLAFWRLKRRPAPGASDHALAVLALAAAVGTSVVRNLLFLTVLARVGHARLRPDRRALQSRPVAGHD